MPTVIGSASQPLVSSYPAGQGLATINSAYPASAAYQPIYSTSTTTAAAATSSGLTTSDYLIFAAIAAAAWYFLRNKR